MVAWTIGEVRTALAGDCADPAFATGFADAYFGPAFGVLPKTEIDRLVFRLLVETGAIDGDGLIFAMARALNVTPAKARNLLFQCQLRWIDEVKADAAVLRNLATLRFSVDQRRMAFGIESPLSTATIEGRLTLAGVYAYMRAISSSSNVAMLMCHYSLKIASCLVAAAQLRGAQSRRFRSRTRSRRTQPQEDGGWEGRPQKTRSGSGRYGWRGGAMLCASDGYLHPAALPEAELSYQAGLL